MATEVINNFVADVKCYFCGHVSGQIVGKRNAPMKLRTSYRDSDTKDQR